jgi:hypothetical protein
MQRLWFVQLGQTESDLDNRGGQVSIGLIELCRFGSSSDGMTALRLLWMN